MKKKLPKANDDNIINNYCYYLKWWCALLANILCFFMLCISSSVVLQHMLAKWKNLLIFWWVCGTNKMHTRFDIYESFHYCACNLIQVILWIALLGIFSVELNRITRISITKHMELKRIWLFPRLVNVLALLTTHTQLILFSRIEWECIALLASVAVKHFRCKMKCNDLFINEMKITAN